METYRVSKKSELYHFDHLHLHLDFPSAMGSMSLKTKTKQDKAYVLENLARQHSTLVMILGLKMVSREALTNHNQKWVLWGHIFP